MDPTVHLVTPATRRAVVKTGAKLAYAAPLVATSLTLSATNAAAAMSAPKCTADFEPCGGELSHLFCLQLCSAENELFCAESLILPLSCTSDADCREGRCEPFNDGSGQATCTVQPCDSTADCNCHFTSCRCWPDPFSGGRGICRRDCGSG